MAKAPSDRTMIISEDEEDVVVLPMESAADAPKSKDSDDQADIPDSLGVLPIRNMVIFPGTVVPLTIGREASKLLINDVLPDEKIIAVVCQKDSEVDDPAAEDLYSVGTAVTILKLLKLEDGNQSIIVHGLSRVKVSTWESSKPYHRATVQTLSDESDESTEVEALVVNVRDSARRAIELSQSIPDEATVVLNNIEAPGALADFLATNMPLEISERQELLEEVNVTVRLKKIVGHLQHQLEVLELSAKIRGQVQQSIDKSQREYFLTEQLKAIQKELGQLDDKSSDIEELREKIQQADMPPAVAKEVNRDLDRLKSMPSASPEYHLTRTYLEWMSELPWSRFSEDRIDIKRAREILDADHYDLDKVKRRICEYLAVRKLAPDSRGPILCFVGAPGVGKTSLGQSIAKALGRKFIRMSLGGMRDEAELRGHRRTYIGAMPGRIIQEIRKAGTNNPVFMLDELDKVGADFRGDPTSALLEILDPAQNSTFQDHYLSVPFDLSKVMFIATANYMGTVPPALRDRMEVISLSGYTQNEKLHIAKNYLVPRQLEENGLTASQAKWTDKALAAIIDGYTREAGVRELERQIGAVCRGIAALVASGKSRGRTVTPALAKQMLGPRQYESELALRTSTPGVATGLAYTPSGGEIIFIEAAAFPGKGRMTLTGQIGDVMKESAQAAMSLVKSRLNGRGDSSKTLDATDIHVHLPAGAVPKDGPSAGAALFIALTSLLENRSVRADVAMTGEITLRGLVLPVGGIKEKILAAKRAGIKTVVLPERNRKDLSDLPADTREGMDFEFARTVDDVLAVALAPLRSSRRRHKGNSASRRGTAHK